MQYDSHFTMKIFSALYLLMAYLDGKNLQLMIQTTLECFNPKVFFICQLLSYSRASWILLNKWLH